jgi:hypothetical protein
MCDKKAVWLDKFDENGPAYCDRHYPGRLSLSLSEHWISVKDRLPENEVDVLTYNGRGCSVSHMRRNIVDSHLSHWIQCEDNYDYDNITHWMPLPEPPRNEDELDKC